ncbi:SagB-type dehydrogenase domain-containing protein [Pseudomonas sp. ok272]|uniref:SagB family peptide dehydrogenase n=1 Tax=unclassified Pseudomonas TaxID=196821 RepID=UPI0008C79B28|nr:MULTISPECIES: SagB family peptide dehydrogenase [unclassified Pseudomonas]SEM82044.1 SagB-type dehydrogenase domain-containing protein [Pseudomonas sp. ok272]SFM66427.1 SagB-type dehydrogenase domain-containing protein [Pseudomonas sp. ok602]
MHINPHLFMLARPPYLVVWNYKDHTQYELDPQHSRRLLQLIEHPKAYRPLDEIDDNFINSNILTTSKTPDTEWGWDELSKIFHIGTKNIPCAHRPNDAHEWSRQYLDHCNEVLATPAPIARRGTWPASELIALPAPNDTQGHTLVNTLLHRKTSRTFSGDALSLTDLGTLLYFSLGHLKERECEAASPHGLGARRSSPSGGGLNACEGFIYVRNVNDLAPGLYCYHSAEHALSLVNPLPEDPLGQLLCGQHFINELPLGLFISARFDALWWKYAHSRAYRMAYVEAGHISQTFQLIATALGLSTWLTGALMDDRIETLLGLQRSTEQVLFFVGCGRGDGQALSKELQALIDIEDLR